MLYTHFGEYVEEGTDFKYKQQEIQQVWKTEVKTNKN